jgi:hypothetical protein
MQVETMREGGAQSGRAARSPKGRAQSGKPARGGKRARAKAGSTGKQGAHWKAEIDEWAEGWPAALVANNAARCSTLPPRAQLLLTVKYPDYTPVMEECTVRPLAVFAPSTFGRGAARVRPLLRAGPRKADHAGRRPAATAPPKGGVHAQGNGVRIQHGLRRGEH